MARIIISAGHTNKDPGTIVENIREVDLTRNIAKEVTKLLRDDDIITLAVPPDLDLARRIEWINQTGYTEANNDLAIEIHINDGGEQGIEGWYQADRSNSKNLTEKIVSSVTKGLNWKNQGVQEEYKHPLGSLAFLHNTHPIASLIECGYLDNENDRKFLTSEDGIKKLAKQIVEGIKDYLNPKTESQPKVTNDTQTATPQVNIQTPISTPTPVNNFNISSGFGTPYTPQLANTSPMGSFGGGYNPPQTNQAGFMTREQRKEMIVKNYVKILGREPNQTDLNYFLNTGINEEQLIRKMVDSQEHVDLVKARQEVIQTKKQFVDQQNELLRLRARVNDQRGIIENLNKLLVQKNRAIFGMQQKLKSLGLMKKPLTKKAKIDYKKTTSEKFLDFFSEKLGK